MTEPGEVRAEERDITPEQRQAMLGVVAAMRPLTRDVGITVLVNFLVDVCRGCGISLEQLLRMFQLVWAGKTAGIIREGDGK